MSITNFIPIDFKVIEVHAPIIARASGQQVTHIIGALSLLWHRVFSLKQETVTRIGLAGLFGPESLDIIIEACVNEGILTPVGGEWRIKGADHFKRVSEARSRGGKAASGNLKRGTLQPGEIPGSLPAPAGEQPGNSRSTAPGSTPALYPRSEIRDPNRGSMSSPRRDHAPDLSDERRAPEDIQTRGGYDIDARATAFIAWAKALDPALADPGPGVTTWARDFFAKYQPDDDTGIQAAFANFLLWAHQARKRPGWGLWLSENVWLERWNTVRAEQRGAA